MPSAGATLSRQRLTQWVGLDGGLTILLIGQRPGEKDLQVRGPSGVRMVRGFQAVVDVKAGHLKRGPCNARFERTADVDVVTHGTGEHPPVRISVGFSVRTNSPFSVGPHCATVSPSRNPGSASTSSPAPRTWIQAPTTDTSWWSRHPGFNGDFRQLQIPVGRHPYLVLTSARDITDSLFPMTEDTHRYAGIPYERQGKYCASGAAAAHKGSSGMTTPVPGR